MIKIRRNNWENFKEKLGFFLLGHLVKKDVV